MLTATADAWPRMHEVEWTLTLSAAPAATPISDDEVFAFGRIDLEADRALVNTLIDAATGDFQEVTGLQLVTATYRLDLSRFPRRIVLPKSPLVWATSADLTIQYVDADGATQTLALLDGDGVANYVIARREKPPYLEAAEALNKVWPATRTQPEAVTVTFKAGFGAAADVPAAIRRELLSYVSLLYRNREPIPEFTAATQRMLELWRSRSTGWMY